MNDDRLVSTLMRSLMRLSKAEGPRIENGVMMMKLIANRVGAPSWRAASHPARFARPIVANSSGFFSAPADAEPKVIFSAYSPHNFVRVIEVLCSMVHVDACIAHA